MESLIMLANPLWLSVLGATFLMPVLVLLLHRAELVTHKQLVGARRYAIVGKCIVAAVRHRNHLVGGQRQQTWASYARP